MSEIANLKRQVQQLTAQKKYVWCHYFGLRNNFFNHIVEQTKQIQSIVDMIDEMDQSEIPPKFVEMIGKITNIAVKNEEFLKCSICLELLQPETIDTSKCGHIYCKKCLDKLKKTKKCAVCRATL
jgi:hypothetical protein